MYSEQYYSNESQFNLNCTNFTVEDLKVVNGVRNATASLCSLASLAILIFLICSKAFNSLFKRLYLYLVIGTLVTEIVLALSIEHQWNYKGQETICIVVGVLSQWTYVMIFVLSYEVVFHLLCVVVSQIRGSQQKQHQRKICTITIEVVYIILPITISTVVAVPPVFMKSYGIAGPWCWVQSLDKNCKPSGLVIQMIFFGMYMTAGIVGITASVVFFIIYCKIAITIQGARKLLKQTLVVMIFQTVHILIIMYNLAARLYTLLSHRHQLYGLWLVHAITLPVGVFVFPLGYLLSFYYAGDTLRNNIISKCGNCKCTGQAQDDEHQHLLTSTGTAPESTRVSPPSETYYIVSHPASDECNNIN